MAEHNNSYDVVPEYQQRWHSSKPFGRLDVPYLQRAAGPCDWPFYAAVLAILIAAISYSTSDKGIYHQSLQTHSQLVGHDSKGQYQIRLDSTLTAVDIRQGTIQIEFAGSLINGDHSRYCSDRGAGWHYQLILGSMTDKDSQVVLPACTAAAQQPFTLTMPIRRPARHSSLDGYSTQLSVRLQRAPETVNHASGHQRLDMVQDSWPGGPVVSWSATWTAGNMQVAVQRLTRYQEGLRLAAASGVNDDPQGLFADVLSDQLYGRQDEAVYVLQLTQSCWCRIIQMTAALLQILAVGYCLVVFLGHLLCVLLMQRLLCNRVHGVWQ